MILENTLYHSRKQFQGIDFTDNGILLGETVFTSFRTHFKKVPFLNEHLDRLEKGCQFLFGKNVDKESILGALKPYLEKDQKIRITIFKSNDDLKFIIQESPLIDSGNISLTKAMKIKTQGLIPPFLKTGNYLESNLEVKRANSLGFDDIIFTDFRKNILECSTSNIFAIKNKCIFTPSVNGSFLNGITRQKIIEMLNEEKMEVCEKEIGFLDLLNSDEIFITNAVKGIRSVTRVEDIKFMDDFTKEIKSNFFQFIRKNCG